MKLFFICALTRDRGSTRSAYPLVVKEVKGLRHKALVMVPTTAMSGALINRQIMGNDLAHKQVQLITIHS